MLFCDLYVICYKKDYGWTHWAVNRTNKMGMILTLFCGGYCNLLGKTPNISHDDTSAKMI